MNSKPPTNYLDIAHDPGTRSILWSMDSHYRVAVLESDRPERDGHHLFAGYDIPPEPRGRAPDHYRSIRRLTLDPIWCARFGIHNIAVGRVDPMRQIGTVSLHYLPPGQSRLRHSRVVDRVIKALDKEFHRMEIIDWLVVGSVGEDNRNYWYYQSQNDLDHQ